MLYGTFKPFNIIEYEENADNTPLDTQYGSIQKPVLGEKIMGWFQPSSSNEAMIASSQGSKTLGYFFTHTDSDVKDGSLVVEASTQMVVRIIGDDLARISLESSEPHSKYTAQCVSWEDIGGEP